MTEPIAIDAQAAAKVCGVSERTLWSLTAPRGPLPVVHVGRRRLYLVDDLKAFLASRRVMPRQQLSATMSAKGEAHDDHHPHDD